MRHFKTLALLVLALGAGAGLVNAQTALSQTTLSAAITASQNSITVGSASGIVATQTVLFIDNEAAFVNSVNGKVVYVTRGYAGTKSFAHKSGTMVLAGPPAAFISYSPSGSCTVGSGLYAYAPVINVRDGSQWLCSSVTGKVVPGFANFGDAPQTTAAVASAAGAITPSGLLFHITGTAAITGFNIPVGFDPTAGGTVCAIPDGAFTTTTAGNIALGSTAVVSKVLCWTYDASTAKFYPSY